MMNKIVVSLLLAGAVCSVSACSRESRAKWGLVRNAPNEFMVAARAPLSLPPEYDLRPVAEIQTVDIEVKTEGLTEGEKILMEKINIEANRDDIKEVIDAELKQLNNE